MANDLLNEFADLQAAQQQFDYLEKRLTQYVTDMKAASKLSIKSFADLENANNLKATSDGSKKAAEANKILAVSLAGLTETYEKVNVVMAALNGHSPEYIRNLKNMEQADKTAAQTATESSKQRTQAAKQQTESEKQKTEQNRRNVAEFIALSRAETEESRQAANARIAAAKAETETSKQIANANISAAKTETELAKQKEIETRYTIALNKEKERLEKLSAKEQVAANKLTNEYEQLKRKYNETANEAKRLAAVYGVNSVEAKAFTDEAKVLNDQLLQIEVSVGQHQRNVGNYASATMALSQLIREAPAFANSVQTGLSALSNNFPILFDEFKRLREAVGSTGKAFSILFKSVFSFTNLFVLGYAAFEIFGKQLFQVSEETKKAREEQDRYNESLKSIERNAYAAASSEASRLNLLVTISRDLKQATETRLLAVQALQAEFPKYFANLDKEVILNGNVADAVNGATQAIFKKAAATAATSKFEEASKREYELMVKQREALKEVNALHEKYDKIIAEEDAKFRKGEEADAGPGRLVNEAEQRLADIVKLRNGVRKEMRGYLSDAQKLAEELGADFFKGSLAMPNTIAALQEQVTFLTKKRDELTKVNTAAGINQARQISAEIEKIQDRIAYLQGRDTTNKAPKDHTLKNEQDLTKAIYDEKVKQLQIEAQIQKAIADDETKSLDVRVNAYQNYAELTLEAQLWGLEGQRAAIQDSLTEITRIEGKAAKDRTQQEKDLLARKAIFEQQFTNLAKQEELIRLEDIEKTAHGIVAIQQNEVKRRADAIKDLSDNVDSQEAEAQKKLSDRYLAGELSYRQYVSEKKRIENEYQKEKQQQTRDYLQAEIDDLAKQGVNTIELQRLLNQALKNLYDADLQNAIEAEKKKQERKQQLQQKSFELANEGLNLGQAIFDASYQKQITALENKITSINAVRDADIAAINDSAQSEEKKAFDIKARNAQALAQEKMAMQEISRLKRQQAIADRVSSILRVVAKTAEAVLGAVAASPTTGGLPFSAINAAIGAVQIATILATPLPQYGDGTGKGVHPGGLAVLGDKYERERVEEPGKAPYWSAATPTVYNLAAGTRVTPERLIPQEELLASSLGFMTPALLRGINVIHNHDYSSLKAATEKGFAKVEEAINNKPVPSWTANNGEWRKIVQRGNSTTQWLTDNF